MNSDRPVPDLQSEVEHDRSLNENNTSVENNNQQIDGQTNMFHDTTIKNANKLLVLAFEYKLP